MARKPLDIKIRVERQEKKILKLTEQLEEQKEEDKKILFETYRKSKRSLDEVLEFMNGKADI